MEITEEDGGLWARDQQDEEHEEQEAEHVVHLVRPGGTKTHWLQIISFIHIPVRPE